MSKQVLIAPLHWGLGHAARCIPIIQAQLNEGHRVVVAATGGPKALLSNRFDGITFIDIPFMEITYPRDGNMSRHFFWKGPRLIKSIWREHQLLQNIVRDLSIDMVISDSRFGLWSANAHCVFITHQVHILSPYAERIINSMNRWIMARFDEVWIPDVAHAPGLAGRLSHPKTIPSNAKYIGPLSRFSGALRQEEMKWDTVALISGPEPQRSLFEAEMARRFIESGEKALILQGKPHTPNHTEIGHLTIRHHLADHELLLALKSARHVIARSGYSTIMDFDVLGIRAEYHPTPGQTEQEYLAHLHQAK